MRVASSRPCRSGRQAGAEKPETHQAAARQNLAERIVAEVQAKGMTQMEAAKVLEIDQPKVSRLLNGRLTEFSTARLMRFLALLGHDVEIVVHPAPGRSGSMRTGQLMVVSPDGVRR